MSRKDDHIQMAFDSQTQRLSVDSRFDYEPLFSKHMSVEELNLSTDFAGKKMTYPIWFSSMTGGAKHAKNINSNMAKVCAKYGLGMGLGSCRPLLDSDQSFDDFNVREILGDDRPFYANLGLAQIEQLIKNNQQYKILEMIKRLEADGLIIHINPLQEWFQPEGDRFDLAPIEIIEKLINLFEIKIIVKEVGQGMGPASLKALSQLPITAIEFAAYGGTNFSKLEAMRKEAAENKAHLSRVEVGSGLINVGHTALNMVNHWNKIAEEFTRENRPQKGASLPDIIISGGVKDALDAHYLMSKSQFNNSRGPVIGLASQVLKHAMISEESLDLYIEQYLETLAQAQSFLKVRD